MGRIQSGLRGSRRNGRRRRGGGRAEVKPMESVANLVDIMLVFACGLMVAIIIYWNVDLNHIVNIIDQDQLVEITDSETIEENQAAISDYDNLGTAIEDPNTGKMLVVDGENIDSGQDEAEKDGKGGGGGENGSKNGSNLD